MRHAWDVFGREDGLGTLNLLTPARRRASLASVRSGETVCLTLPLDEPRQPPFGRESLQHEVFPLNSFSWDDRITRLNPQASTQWDGLMHVGHKGVGFYGGHGGPPEDSGLLGIHRWAATGIVGRGVLIDVATHFRGRWAGYDPLSRLEVTPEHLDEVLSQQQTTLQPGDVLCVRFGWHTAMAQRTPQERSRLSLHPECAGLSAQQDMARYLWDHQVAAVVSDNPTVEVQPGDGAVGFLHQRLLTMLGMPLGELFDLDPLSQACLARRAWDFVFLSVPLNLPGGVGSPGNAVALI
jgi:kynurenine formamidase